MDSPWLFLVRICTVVVQQPRCQEQGLTAWTYCAVYVTANISGGHLNPAITLPTIMTGHTSMIKGAAYIIAQLAGSTVGSLLLVSL